MTGTGISARRCGDVALAVLGVHLLMTASGASAWVSAMLLREGVTSPGVAWICLTPLAHAACGAAVLLRRRRLLDRLDVREAHASAARRREDLLVAGLAVLGVWRAASSALACIQPFWTAMAGAYSYGPAELVELLFVALGVLLVRFARPLARLCPAVRG